MAEGAYAPCCGVIPWCHGAAPYGPQPHLPPLPLSPSPTPPTPGGCQITICRRLTAELLSSM
jgi:hypothetical protein